MAEGIIGTIQSLLMFVENRYGRKEVLPGNPRCSFKKK